MFIVLFIICFTTAVKAGSMKSVTGTIIETGELITVRLSSDSGPLLTFNADIPKYEMTTGLTFAGDITKGQTVRLVYGEEPENGCIQGKYVLFNPDNPAAADIDILLHSIDNGVIISDNNQYLLYADAETDITDSQGRKAELRAGQYILGWFREVLNESAVLSKAVILNLSDDIQICKQINISDTGDVLLDDGPIVKLDEFQAAICRRYHMAPIRPIAEALGYAVEWEPNRTIHIMNSEYSFIFSIDDEYYQLNDTFVYFSGKRFIIIKDQTFADYTVINALVNRAVA